MRHLFFFVCSFCFVGRVEVGIFLQYYSINSFLDFMANLWNAWNISHGRLNCTEDRETHLVRRWKYISMWTVLDSKKRWCQHYLYLFLTMPHTPTLPDWFIKWPTLLQGEKFTYFISVAFVSYNLHSGNHSRLLYWRRKKKINCL